MLFFESLVRERENTRVLNRVITGKV